ncbi:MAG: HPr-rel-A system PqqD family peptide chaperone [Methylovulum sp.]|nr:HPr-rel-A system PqqD family peptide chaperone [Methylovulum sp.]
MTKNYSITVLKPAGVFCHFWADECVVYHEPSAKTHLIDGLGAEIFKWLAGQTLTFDQLLGHLQEAFEFPDDVGPAVFLERLLAEYRVLGLLEFREH